MRGGATMANSLSPPSLWLLASLDGELADEAVALSVGYCFNV
jgi:hypothetical protein